MADTTPTQAANAYGSQYFTTYAASSDTALRHRIAAATALQASLHPDKAPNLNAVLTDPQYYLKVCSVQTSPTIWSAWQYALGITPPNPFPGSDTGVITDAVILDAVQHVLGISA